jgi:hypothetical protein
MIQSTAVMRLASAPTTTSTMRSGRSSRPTVQRGIRLSARARAYDVMKLPKAATQTSTMCGVLSSRA